MLVNAHDFPAAAMFQGIGFIVIAIVAVVLALRRDSAGDRAWKRQREEAYKRQKEAHDAEYEALKKSQGL